MVFCSPLPNFVVKLTAWSKNTAKFEFQFVKFMRLLFNKVLFQRKVLCHFHFSSLLSRGQLLKERICSSRRIFSTMSNFFPLRAMPFLEEIQNPGKQTGSKKNPSLKNGKKTTMRCFHTLWFKQYFIHTIFTNKACAYNIHCGSERKHIPYTLTLNFGINLIWLLLRRLKICYF